MNKGNDEHMSFFVKGFFCCFVICALIFGVFLVQQLNSKTLDELEREIEAKQDMIEKMQEYGEYAMVTWWDNNQTYMAKYEDGRLSVTGSESGEIVSRQ